MYSLRLLLSLIMVGFVAAPAAAENSDPASTGTWQSQGRPSLYGSDDENADQEGDDSEAAGTARGRMGVSREGSDIGSGGVQSLGGDGAYSLQCVFLHDFSSRTDSIETAL